MFAWIESFILSTSSFLKTVQQSSFDDSDVNDAFFSLLSHLLGYGLNATSWCDEKASVVDKIRAHGVDTEESAFFGLNGGCFVICGQGRAGNRSTFLAYTPVDIDLEKDIIIRPENSLSLSMRSVKLRARPFTMRLIRYLSHQFANVGNLELYTTAQLRVDNV
ncbi:hypothetical protein CGCF413_v008996 [Colletotrichum fructicola]|nr:hypothetical protein CGCF413_v008996 [Colletotrichum fructicola]